MMILEDEWTHLAELLRGEVEGYGRLFRLLEQQREHLLKQRLEGLLQSIEEMNALTEELRMRKVEREQLVNGLWERSEFEDTIPSIQALLDRMPPASEPMLRELLSEVNRLVGQSRHHLQRNHMLLRRSHEIGQRFLRILNPDTIKTSVYQRNGRTAAGAGASGVLGSRYRQEA